jgi:hypothetical protein
MNWKNITGYFRSHWRFSLFLFCFLFLLLSYFLPAVVKTVFFIIVLGLVSYALAPDSKYINIFIFLGVLAFYFLLPTNLLTFNISKPMNFVAVERFAFGIIDVVSIIFFVGIPLLAIVGSIYALIIGKVSSAITTIVQTILAMGFVSAFALIFKVFGIQLFGITDFILNFYAFLLELILMLPVVIYAGMDGLANFVSLGLVDLPNLPSSQVNALQNIRFDALFTQLSSMNHQTLIFSIHDSLPFFLALICLVSMLIFSRREWEREVMRFINEYEFNPKSMKPKRRYLPYLNIKMLFYILFLLIAGFGIFLTYNKIYAHTGKLNAPIFTDLSYFGYFSIYLFMSIIPLTLIAINPRGFFYYKDATAGNTIFGTIFGVLGLFLLLQIFNSATRTFDALSLDYVSQNILYIANTFVFIAPSETILFHFFFQALILGSVLTYTKRTMDNNNYLTVNQQLEETEDKIYVVNNVIEIHKGYGNKEGIAKAQQRLNQLEQKKRKLKRDKKKIILTEKSIYSKFAYIVLILVFAIVFPNFIFAIFHWITSEIDFFIFWSSGLGVIYLISGAWMNFITMRYGWLAGILTHALHNSSQIILILIFTGVV